MHVSHTQKQEQRHRPIRLHVSLSQHKTVKERRNSIGPTVVPPKIPHLEILWPDYIRLKNKKKNKNIHCIQLHTKESKHIAQSDSMFHYFSTRLRKWRNLTGPTVVVPSTIPHLEIFWPDMKAQRTRIGPNVSRSAIRHLCPPPTPMRGNALEFYTYPIRRSLQDVTPAQRQLMNDWTHIAGVVSAHNVVLRSHSVQPEIRPHHTIPAPVTATV